MRDDWICDECGKHFDWDYRFKDCDECHGDLTEADRCPFCGDWKRVNDTYCEVCSDMMYTPDAALLVAEGQGHREKVEVNGFVFDALGVELINEILEDYVRENAKLPYDSHGSLRRALDFYMDGDPEWNSKMVHKSCHGAGADVLARRTGVRHGR